MSPAPTPGTEEIGIGTDSADFSPENSLALEKLSPGQLKPVYMPVALMRWCRGDRTEAENLAQHVSLSYIVA